MKKIVILYLLVMGFAHQVDSDFITVKYKRGAVTMTSKVSKSMSACVPRVGQKVFFYKNYKVVECVEQL